MIVTVTPNPSVDRTVHVDTLVRGAVLRARAAAVDAGGKGVNVARALAANGHRARAVLPCGGAEGAQLAGLLLLPAVELVLVPVAGAIRANISIVEPDGTVTKINEPGPELSPEETEAVIAATVQAAAGADWVAASGSLPHGVPDDFYTRLFEGLAPGRFRIALDRQVAKQNRSRFVPQVAVPEDSHLLFFATISIWQWGQRFIGTDSGAV